MLTIVTANPMQFTIVREVPLDSSGAFCATRVENRGESAMTTNPQKNKKLIKRTTEWEKRKSGEIIQHKQDKNNATVAVFFMPR